MILTSLLCLSEPASFSLCLGFIGSHVSLLDWLGRMLFLFLCELLIVVAFHFTIVFKTSVMLFYITGVCAVCGTP